MSIHSFFWQQHPAFLYAITLLTAVGSTLFFPEPWRWIFLLFWAGYLMFLKRWPALLLLPAMAVYCIVRVQPAPDSKAYTEAIFTISSVQSHSSPFQRGWAYKGDLYLPEGRFPCTIYTGQHNAPAANRDYFLSGKLLQRSQFELAFKPNLWIPIPDTWNLASVRADAKEWYRSFLEQKCSHEKAAGFLTALTTGDVEDRLLKYEFGRLGLQHILAISGFHFGVLIAFSTCVLSLFLPRFGKWLLLLVLLSAYYFFVGPFPGVQRSWMTAALYLIGKLLKRHTSGLNLLGFTLGVEITANPLIAANIGFQLSFASCTGILLLYPLCEHTLQPLLPKRNQQEKLALSFLEKHICLISSFLRKALSLTLSVNAAILPILLVHFHLFPPLSLLYNLFYPFLIGITLSSLLLALIIHLLFPPLAALLFFTTSWLTQKLLDITSYPPLLFDTPLFVPHFPEWAVPICLLFLLFIAIHLNKSYSPSVTAVNNPSC